MYKIGIIGDKDSILGFKALGMDVFPVIGAAEAEKTLDRLANNQYAVIYITESIASEIAGAIEKYSSSKIPAVILVPGNQGTTGLGMQRVKKTVERAVGADILFRD